MRIPIMALEVTFLLTSLIFAEPIGTTETGRVIGRIERRLLVRLEDNATTRNYDVAAGVPVTLDGKASKLEELQDGDCVVITLADDKVKSIDAKSARLSDFSPQARRVIDSQHLR